MPYPVWFPVFASRSSTWPEKPFSSLHHSHAAGTTVANGFIQNDRGWNVYFYRKFVPIEDMGGAITNRNHTPINFPVIRFCRCIVNVGRGL